MDHTPRQSSQIFLEIAQNNQGKENLTFRDIIQSLGQRAFGLALLFFTLPSALPISVVPGISFIFSLPIMIFALQMIFARKTLWLPTFLAERPIPHSVISKIAQASIPALKKFEYFLKPRWGFMSHRYMEIFNGVMIFFLSILLMLPIPFSNFLFSSLLIIFSLGFIEKDGIFIAVGHIASFCYIYFIYFIIKTAIRSFFN